MGHLNFAIAATTDKPSALHSSFGEAAQTDEIVAAVARAQAGENALYLVRLQAVQALVRRGLSVREIAALPLGMSKSNVGRLAREVTERTAIADDGGLLERIVKDIWRLDERKKADGELDRATDEHETKVGVLEKLKRLLFDGSGSDREPVAPLVVRPRCEMVVSGTTLTTENRGVVLPRASDLANDHLRIRWDNGIINDVYWLDTELAEAFDQEVPPAIL